MALRCSRALLHPSSCISLCSVIRAGTKACRSSIFVSWTTIRKLPPVSRAACRTRKLPLGSPTGRMGQAQCPLLQPTDSALAHHRTRARRQRLVAPLRAARRPMPLAPVPQIPHRAALGAPSTSSSGMRSRASSGTMKRLTSCGTVTTKLPPTGGAPVSPVDG